jgi:2-keto-4-pentenoate hydratase/2-oxohepta-3-ene-1,7-dioic acid hydratase in catechol pathway
MNVVALAGGIGRLEADGSVAELDASHPSLIAFLRDGGRLEQLADMNVRSRMPLQECALAPAAGPGASVWGVGLNYRSKAVATGRHAPEHPALYVKGPGSICSAGHPIVLPAASRCVDYEGEIAVLLGADLFEASVEEASEAIAGILAANDVTARDVMRATGNPSLAKSFPGFGQLGSIVAPTGGAPREPITIDVTVNGVHRQVDDSRGMLLPVAELVALIARYTPLRPGDVVLTGTPAGTGDERGSYLEHGDVIEVAVGELPPLRSVVSRSIPADSGPARATNVVVQR